MHTSGGEKAGVLQTGSLLYAQQAAKKLPLGQLIGFSAGKLTGTASNTYVAIKVKSVLFHIFSVLNLADHRGGG